LIQKKKKKMRLISASQLLRSGLRLEANAKMHIFRDENNRAVITGVSGHYQNIPAVLSKIIKRHPKEFAKALQPADYLTWHHRLGHPSDFVLSQFCEETLGVPRIMIPKTKAVCDGCVKGKLTQKQFPTSESRAKGILELIHLDLFKLPVISYHCHKWVMTVMDDYSGIAFIIMISKKSDAPHQMIKVLTFLATSTSQKVKRLRTNRGGEYTSGVLKEYLDTNGIQHEMSSPHVHQQNGRAEQLNRTLHEKSQAMRLQACLPDSYWGFSMSYAVHLYNQSPMQRLKWKTPHELFYGTRPNLSLIRVFGCGAHVFLPDEI
jgi:hypothetical protein